MTKYVDVGALQMVWMTIWLSSQLVLAFADEYWHFIAGMILFACGVSGYSGLKYVIHYDLVGGKYMQYIIAYGKFLRQGYPRVYNHCNFRYCIGCSNFNRGPISCLSPV